MNRLQVAWRILLGKFEPREPSTCLACAAKDEMVRFLYGEVDGLRLQVRALYARDGVELPEPPLSAPQVPEKKREPKQKRRVVTAWANTLAANGHLDRASLLREIDYQRHEEARALEPDSGPTPAGYVEEG